MDDEDDRARPSTSHQRGTENGQSKAGKKKSGALKSCSPSVLHGTGLNAPLTGNLAAMRKLNWIDPDPDTGDGGPDDNYGDGGETLGMKRKRVSYTTVVEGGKKRKIVDIVRFVLYFLLTC